MIYSLGDKDMLRHRRNSRPNKCIWNYNDPFLPRLPGFRCHILENLPPRRTSWMKIAEVTPNQIFPVFCWLYLSPLSFLEWNGAVRDFRMRGLRSVGVLLMLRSDSGYVQSLFPHLNEMPFTKQFEKKGIDKRRLMGNAWWGSTTALVGMPDRADDEPGGGIENQCWEWGGVHRLDLSAQVEQREDYGYGCRHRRIHKECLLWKFK